MRVKMDKEATQRDFPAAVRRARGNDARLVAALVALAQGHGTLRDHRQSPWASVTFSGTRHELCFDFVGPEAVAGAELLIAALPEHEFALPRQLVADAAVSAVEHTMLPQPGLSIRCELLLIDDA